MQLIPLEFIIPLVIHSEKALREFFLIDLAGTLKLHGWTDLRNRKTCILRRPVLSLLYLVCFVSSKPFSFEIYVSKLSLHNFAIHFYDLVTSKPEEGWSGHPNYYFKYTTLYRPSSSLWFIIVSLFKFGWLDLHWDPPFNQAGSSFTALQFV